jgi:demethylmenaquinone methyltransferase/2-methoxy-6-polyprenyl-1,4-benzoquinol methylase
MRVFHVSEFRFMLLKTMFSSITPTYDSVNCLLTGTLDKMWRSACAKQCAVKGTIVDLCCGTGTLSFNILKNAAPSAHVVGVDFSKEMLGKAVEKKVKSGYKLNLSLIQADAAHLPFRDESIDRTGISFAFRNLIYKNPQANACLIEVNRTLRDGGKFVCVETSQPKPYLVQLLYHLYLRAIVPLVGGLLSRRKNAYRYLGMSATNFPPAEEISRMLLHSGFQNVSLKRLTLGLVALHKGVKSKLSHN